MNRVLSSNEILGTVDLQGQETEVVASAEATYDDGKGELVLELGAFLRPVDIRHKERHLGADWLPRGQVVREHVSRDEAGDLAKDVFHRWVVRVRQSIPMTIHNS
jgi:hypothetical protein